MSWTVCSKMQRLSFPLPWLPAAVVRSHSPSIDSIIAAIPRSLPGGLFRLPSFASPSRIGVSEGSAYSSRSRFIEVHEELRWLLRAASSMSFRLLIDCAYQSISRFFPRCPGGGNTIMTDDMLVGYGNPARDLLLYWHLLI